MRNHRAAGLPLVTIAQPPWTKAMRGVAMGTGVSRRNDPGKRAYVKVQTYVSCEGTTIRYAQ